MTICVAGFGDIAGGRGGRDSAGAAGSGQPPREAPRTLGEACAACRMSPAAASAICQLIDPDQNWKFCAQRADQQTRSPGAPSRRSELVWEHSGLARLVT